MWLYVGSVQSFVSLLFASICYIIITRHMPFNILSIFVFLFCMFVFLFCIFRVLFLFHIFVQDYRPLPPGGNPIAVNKYHVSYLCFLLYAWTGIAQSVQRLATGWTIRGSNPGGGEIFRTRSDRSWGPPSLLYNWYLVFPGGKAAGAW